jgi:SynChlorMet cassette radical SAM/SPASM protein ScmF
MQGSFEKAKNAVRNLVAVDTPPQIIMTLMRKNRDQMVPVIRMAEKLGASSIKFNVVQPTARGKSLYENSLALSIKEIIALGHKIENELSATTRLRLFFDFPMAFRSLKRIFNGDGCSTCNIFSILGVIATGHYALCGIGTHVPELVFGEVGKDRLETVWKQNETLQLIREGLPQRLEGICARCLMKRRCLGACLAQNYYRTKSLWAPYWFCEMAAAEGLFPQSRLMPGADGKDSEI